MTVGDTWLELACSECSATNWCNVGDLSDLSGMDYEAASCWSCRELFWINPELDDLDRTADSLDDAEVCEGVERP